MRLIRILLILAPGPFFAGCGFIHFGRQPSVPSGELALNQAYSDLSTEHKILQRELALARKEGDAMRQALENSTAGGTSADLATKLNDATRELATLRSGYATLLATRANPINANEMGARGQLSEVENKLATSLRQVTDLQQENAHLRSDVDRARTENAGLAQNLKTTTAQNEQAQNALSQLNTELLMQKEARGRAEQAAAAAKAQLATVVAQSSRATASLSGGARGTGAGNDALLETAKTPPAEASATAELRTSPERIRPSAPPAKSDGTGTPRVHVVKEGDTLDGIARHYYNDPERWRSVYEANLSLIGEGRPLRPGMELEIPP